MRAPARAFAAAGVSVAIIAVVSGLGTKLKTTFSSRSTQLIVALAASKTSSSVVRFLTASASLAAV